MWLIKLPFKIIALPIIAIVAVLSLFYSLALHLSSLIVGLGFLLLGFCILSLLVQQMWALAAIVFGVAVLAFLTVMLAEMVSLGLEALVGKLSKFIFHNERYCRTRGVRTPRAFFMPAQRRQGHGSHTTDPHAREQRKNACAEPGRPD